MKINYVIEEKCHCGSEGSFDNLDDALAELLKRKDIPYDEEPNRAPCVGWKNCNKEYELLEYKEFKKGWKLTTRKTILVTAKGGNKWVYK